MKIVVAGGSGFIGSHVVDVLLDKGHEVLIYDLEAPHYGQTCAFVRGDTRDIDRMAQVFKSGDVVYLIAAEANVNRFFESPCFPTTSRQLQRCRSWKLPGAPASRASSWHPPSGSTDRFLKREKNTLPRTRPIHKIRTTFTLRQRLPPSCSAKITGVSMA